MKRILVLLVFLFFIPTTFAQWEMLNSPLATPDIRLVAFHPNGYLLAISNLNEVFRSTVGSEVWTKIAVLDSAVRCIAIAPNDVVYAGINGGYLYSSDIGLNWGIKQILPPNIYGHYISDIEFDSLGNIFMCSNAAAASGIWISTDNGENWNKYSNGLNGISLSSLTRDSFGNLYTLTRTGDIFKSTDQGLNWQLKFYIQSSSYKIEIDEYNNLFVASGIGIYKSTDLGDAWIQISNLSVKTLSIENNIIYAIRGGYYGIIFSSDGGNNWVNIGLSNIDLWSILAEENSIFVGTIRGLRQTSNLGSSWNLSFQYDDKFVSINDILILSVDTLFASTNEGVHISTNNGQLWNHTTLTSNTKSVRDDYLGNLFTVSDSFYKSTDKGLSWLKCHNNASSVSSLFINDSGHVFFAEDVDRRAVWKSTNQGNTWQSLLGSLNPYDISSKVYELKQNNLGELYLSFRVWGVYHPGNIWVDNRYLWKYQGNYTWEHIIDDKIIPSICFLSDTMFLATQEEGIYKSYDGGYNLIPINNGLISTNIKQIINTPQNVLICLASDGVYRSLDNGNFWVNLGLDGLLSTSINSIYYSKDNVLYACTDNGIGMFIGELPVELTSLTASIGINKVQLNWQTATELNNQGFEIQRKLENSDWITIGFRTGKGTTSEPTSYFYEDDISEISFTKILYRLKQMDFDGTVSYSDEIEVVTQPFDYALSQNYPNPFNPETIIKYEVPQISNVIIEVFDVLGRVIKVLVDEEKTAGRYENKFDASSLASGIYYYRIKSNEFVQTKKMMLIK